MRKILKLGAIVGMVFTAQHATAQNGDNNPCVAGPFVVFFNADSDTITPQGAAIMDNAVDAYWGCGQGAITISGHTDRKGSDSYNVGLSQRMANNVRTFLTAKGLPGGMITTQAFGETRPLVDTKDGVSEPQNRRVEITFGPGSGW